MMRDIWDFITEWGWPFLVAVTVFTVTSIAANAMVGRLASFAHDVHVVAESLEKGIK